MSYKTIVFLLYLSRCILFDFVRKFKAKNSLFCLSFGCESIHVCGFMALSIVISKGSITIVTDLFTGINKLKNRVHLSLFFIVVSHFGLYSVKKRKLTKLITRDYRQKE